MRVRLLLGLFLALVLALPVVAQDEDPPEDSLYPDVPTVRGEDGAFIIGDPEAPVVVIEFADFLCPFCQEYHTDVVNPFIEEYVLTGQARFEYRFFPVIDPQLSPLMSVVNECAFEQGAFWAAHDYLYELAAANAVDQDLATTVAEELGLDVDQMTECVNGDGPFQWQEDQLYGQDLGVSGTPAIRVRIGDEPAGILTTDDGEFGRGGAPIEALAEFVESDDPAAMVTLTNQVRDPNLLDDTTLADEDACAPPCWRDITPGETPFEDALAMLEEDEGITVIDSQQQGASQIAVFGDAESEDACCNMVSEDGETVSFIQVRSAPLLTLSEVLEVQGEPEYIDGAPFTRDQTVLNLYYPEKSLVVFVFTPGEDAPLTEDSEIVGGVYLAPDIMDQVLASSSLHAWEGLLSLNEYNEGEFELTPGG
jgi:protein-disulfide isomerase